MSGAGCVIGLCCPDSREQVAFSTVFPSCTLPGTLPVGALQSHWRSRWEGRREGCIALRTAESQVAQLLGEFLQGGELGARMAGGPQLGERGQAKGQAASGQGQALLPVPGQHCPGASGGHNRSEPVSSSEKHGSKAHPAHVLLRAGCPHARCPQPHGIGTEQRRERGPSLEALQGHWCPCIS